jgi:putative phage-type endonuclease
MIEQRTEAWHQARLGRVTASRIADVVAKTKTGHGASRANYRAQLIVERLTGIVAESYSNAAMQHGTDTEPQARAAYEFYTDADVVEVGFVNHPTLGMAGCSPDGLVGEFGLVEIKCPNSATHIDTLLTEVIDGKYIKQMQFQMACTGRQFCDFVSFDPRLPQEMQIFIKRIDRDTALIAELEDESWSFLAEIDTTMSRLLAKFSPERAVA